MMILRLIYFLLLLVPFVFCESLADEDPTSESDSNTFVEDLKRYVLSLPLSAFEGDAVLLQFPDPLEKRTTYRHLDPLHAIAGSVYETKGDDTNAHVVILGSDEDNIPPPKLDDKKRTYVVMRQAVQIDRRVYYVAYIYVTEAPDNNPGIHNLGGRKVFLEWDFWDHRETIDARAKSLENAFRCGNSILVPCSSNETMDYPIPPKRPENINIPETSYPAANTKKKEIYKGADGYDPEEFIDIYGDLDREIKVRRDHDTLENLSDIDPPAPYLGRGKYFENANISMDNVHEFLKEVVKIVDNAALGYIKDYQGMYGGLGTSDAKLASVASELGIEGTDDIEAILSSEELQALNAQLKMKTAGGLGGLISSLEEEEEGTSNFIVDQMNDLINPTVAKGRAMGITWNPPEEEKQYVQFGWTKTNGPMVGNDAFVGFGACRYLHVTPEELGKATTFDEHLRIYQRALRTQCVNYDTDFYQEIYKSGLIKDGPKKTFELKKEALHFSIEKLTVKQLKELLRGVQLVAFSRAYNKELRNLTSSPKAPDGSTLSRSVYTLGQVVIGATAYSQENLWVDLRHGFKLNRNMIRTLKVVYQKLGEDKELMGDRDSELEREINYNNRVFIMGLIQYLLRGSTPVYNSSIDPNTNFETFYKDNKRLFEDRVNSRG